MAEQEQPQKRGSGFFRLFERGVDTATRNNVTAYGYSSASPPPSLSSKPLAPIPGSWRSSSSPPERSWPSPSSQPWPQASFGKS
jgi:hypothetical protein